jgi:hypothetical protein
LPTRELVIGAAVGLAVASCSSAEFVDEGLVGLEISSVSPAIIVEGTVIVVDGASFVDSPWGDSSLRFTGTLSGEQVDVSAPARFVDFDRLEVDVTPDFLAELGGAGEFDGEVTVEVVSKVDGETYRAVPLFQPLSFRDSLQPELTAVQSGGVIFVNDPIEVEGAGFLLGGNEGTTYAVVEGCFTPTGAGSCTDIGPIEVPVVPSSAQDRSRGSFAFTPEIAGIEPGSFDGTVSLRNQHGGGASLASSGRQVSYEMVEPAIFSVTPTSASLGQYVDIVGGGFVGGAPGTDTLLELSGTFTPAGSTTGAPVNLTLVPEFGGGRRARYVVNEDDALGQALDLRSDTGTFEGTLTPVISYGGDQVTGSSTQMTLAIAPVKQIVYLRFAPTYVESLRHFGLRAVDQRIRQRVREVVERDYDTINLEVRIEPVDDFALYSQVDIAGPDPNGLGLFGYDNTPGKDVGNERLYDRIGGVNATTQEDGYPGFGGVFIESLFGFSEHPEGRAESLSGADPLFDDIFDEFRPDRGGTRVDAGDLSGGVDPVTDGSACPATDGSRADRLACAIFVLGNLIGTTVSHEIGHSLGLANPFGEGFHNSGDQPARLMDAGAARPFTERSELGGQGPARFCDEAYQYLREILPDDGPPDTGLRPGCF